MEREREREGGGREGGERGEGGPLPLLYGLRFLISSKGSFICCYLSLLS